MDNFFPFIHKIEKKKKDDFQPLYIELEPPQFEREQKNEDEESPGIIILEL
jgi:hypothetical protein